MRILRRSKDRGIFDSLADCIDAPRLYKLMSTGHGRRYYRAVEVEAIDTSFVILERERPIVLVECGLHGGVLSRFGFPIEIRIASGLSLAERSTAVRTVLGEFKQLTVEHRPTAIALLASHALDPDGVLNSSLIGKGVPRIQLVAEADLSLSRDALHHDMSKGHRQQVTWGLSNIAISVIDRAAPDPRGFEIYRQFHARIAGRVTRPDESWQAMYDAIVEGQGSLVLGHLDGRLVAGSLVLDGGDTAYYASGVYDRELFDKPLGHANVYHSMLLARARGRSYFELGLIPLPGQGFDDKEISIGRFKQGFTSRTSNRVVWSIDMAARLSRIDEAVVA